MRRIVIDFDMFTPKLGGVRWSELILQKLLRLMAYANLVYIREHGAPSLYKSGVRYQRETTHENFFTIPAILRDGHADCEDLAAWRVAELWNIGEKAKFLIKKKEYPNGFLLYHILVLREDGTMEDPSRALGMGWNEPPPKRRRK